MKQYLVHGWLVLLSLIAVNVYSESRAAGEIVFGYGTYGGMPYFEENEQGRIHKGITFDFSNKIASKMGRESAFFRVPVNRAEEYLRQGKYDAICLYNPQFFERADQFDWSIPFDQHEEYFIIVEQNSLGSRRELENKLIGTQLGYIYNPLTEALFREGKATRVDKESVDVLYRLLTLNRIDTMIDDENSFFYRKLKYREQIKISQLLDHKYDMHCAISKQSAVSVEKMNGAIQELIQEKAFSEILSNYRLPIEHKSNVVSENSVTASVNRD